MKNSIKFCYQYVNLTLILIMVVGVLMGTAISCSGSGTGPDDSEGFTGNWSMAKWSKSEIQGGTTSINGTAAELILSYNVDLGSSGTGVSRRTAIFQVKVPSSGIVMFDWKYTGFHAFFRSFGELTVRSGSASSVLVDDQATGGQSFTFSGSTSIDVTKGQTLEFEVGGRNFDSNSRLRGDVTITSFRLIR